MHDNDRVRPLSEWDTVMRWGNGDQTEEIPRGDQTEEISWVTAARPPWAESAPKRAVPMWAWLALAAGLVFVMCFAALMVIGLVAPQDKTRSAAVVESTGAAPAAAPVVSKAPAVQKGTVAAKPTPAPEGELKYAKGMKFRAGDFEYTVHGSKCGIKTVGGQYLEHKAQGSFCRLDITAKNITKKPHFFHADSTLSALDTEDRKFSADGEAGIYGNIDAAGFLDQINPGNQVRAFVFFDVPAGAKLASISFSAGVFTLADDVTVRF